MERFARVILGYHGCSTQVAEQLFSGANTLKVSENDFDWLGPGIYFWQANPSRALQFAHEKCAREKGAWQPTVVGAAIDLSLCLDLSTESGVAAVCDAYGLLRETLETAGKPLPSNSGGPDLLMRRLDCAVVRQLHAIRETLGDPPVDTVRGIFVEGDPIYAGSGFRAKTHVQICVRNPACVVGVFRVPESSLQPSAEGVRSQ